MIVLCYYIILSFYSYKAADVEIITYERPKYPSFSMTYIREKTINYVSQLIFLEATCISSTQTSVINNPV